MSNIMSAKLAVLIAINSFCFPWFIHITDEWWKFSR